LLVAVTVLPTAAANWVRGQAIEDRHQPWWTWVSDHIMSWTDTPRRRWTWVAMLTALPLLVVGLTVPAADYLPEGKINFFMGFILGLVVNNAILLVYRARDAEREGMSRRESVASAVRLRLRPILMSTMTSVFGMLPLMLMPGAGTELYRGLATVIVGGMLVSTLFTLILLPSFLRMNDNAIPADLPLPETA